MYAKILAVENTSFWHGAALEPGWISAAALRTYVEFRQTHGEGEGERETGREIEREKKRERERREREREREERERERDGTTMCRAHVHGTHSCTCRYICGGVHELHARMHAWAHYTRNSLHAQIVTYYGRRDMRTRHKRGQKSVDKSVDMRECMHASHAGNVIVLCCVQ